MGEMNYEIRKELDEILSLHIQEENARFEQLSSDIKQLRQDVKDLTAAWQQARGMITLVKWLAGISGGIMVWITFFKDHLK